MDAAKIMAEIQAIDDPRLRKTALGRLHPATHLFVSLSFIIVILSFPKYEISRPLCYLSYLMVLVIAGELPLGVIFRRIFYALPFVVFAGIFNPILDTHRIVVGGLAFSAGWISFAGILIKCALTVGAAVTLVALTGTEGIARAMMAMRLPRTLVAVFSFTCRYIYVLGEEILNTLIAHRLRTPRRKGVSMKNFGPVCGGLFLRSSRRAEEIYDAMRCRGFEGEMPDMLRRRFRLSDVIYATVWAAFFLLMRIYNLPAVLGELVIF